MKAKNIQLNSVYHITLGRNEVLGEVIEATETGWQVRLIASDKVIKVNSEERFLRKARTIPTINEEPVEQVATETPEAAVEAPEAEVAEVETQVPETVATPQIENVATETHTTVTTPQTQGLSGLDAAHKVLLEIGTPLNVRQIADAIRERGYAPNLNGKTPQATISSSLQREIRDKGERSRFYKAGKGQYAACPVQD